MQDNVFHTDLRTRRDLQSGRGDRATETFLHDGLWLIEATFNLCWLPPALVWSEREREREREGGRVGGGKEKQREQEREKETEMMGEGPME